MDASLPGPVQAAYEAGPTGFGLARQLAAAGVGAWSRRRRNCSGPAGDRVKTDARDAVHLARLLRLGEIAAVRVPSRRAGGGPGSGPGPGRRPGGSDALPGTGSRSCCCGTGIVYAGGTPGPAPTTRWLRCASGSSCRGLQLAFEPASRRCCRPWTVATGSTRRSSRWPPTANTPPVVRRLGCLRGISTLTGFGLAVEIGDWNRFTGARSAPISAWCRPRIPPVSPGPRARSQDRQHPRPPAAGRGGLAPPNAPDRPRPVLQRPAGNCHPPLRARGRRRQPAAAPPLDQVRRPPKTPRHRERRDRPRTRRLVLVAGRHGRLDPTDRPAARTIGRDGSAWSDPRLDYEQHASRLGDARSLDQPRTLQPNSSSCGNQPAHISLTARRQRHARHTHHHGRPEAAPEQPARTPLHPAHLTNQPTYHSTGGTTAG